MKKVGRNEKQDTFYDDDIELKKLSSKFNYRKIALETYGSTKAGELQGMQTIYATYDYSRSINEYYTVEECNTPRLLLDTLSLVSTLHDDFENPPIIGKTAVEGIKKKIYADKVDYFSSPEKIFDFDKDISKKSVGRIIDWCRKYGFPFEPHKEL